MQVRRPRLLRTLFSCALAGRTAALAAAGACLERDGRRWQVQQQCECAAVRQAGLSPVLPPRSRLVLLSCYCSIFGLNWESGPIYIAANGSIIPNAYSWNRFATVVCEWGSS